MSRRSFGWRMRAIARYVGRAERARQQEQARLQAANYRALRVAERNAKADAKEAVRLHVAVQMEEAEALTREISDRENAIRTLLTRALAKDPGVDLNAMMTKFEPAKFDEQPWISAAPEPEGFMPEAPGFIARMIPGVVGRHNRRLEEARRQSGAAHAAHLERLEARARALQAFQVEDEARRIELDRTNRDVRELQRGVDSAEHAAVIAYLKLVIDKGLQGEPDAISADVGYSSASRHLVLDVELPEFSAIPHESGFKYIKSTDRFEAIARPSSKRKELYGYLISQVALKWIDTVFRSCPVAVIDCLTVNGMLDRIDPATGHQVRVCLLSVRITADTFHSLNLSQVHPEHCLRSLKASVSRAPAELLPVKPLLELDMVDPRFVDTDDVLTKLDHRPNLMDLTPAEFEGLITNLFATMGLDTRQTRPSRDGGVDCVAFDPRPVFGGKVVIQAKRYKNTVGVSAVRDLFGTVQNEGASKGILVTTSGYGRAAFDFARGKPLELLDGGNLLHLLAEHAEVEARIVMPDGWVDLPIHGE